MKFCIILFLFTIVTISDSALIEGLLNTALDVNAKLHNVASGFLSNLADNLRPQQNRPNQNGNLNNYQPPQGHNMPLTNPNGNFNGQYGNQYNQQPNYNNQPGPNYAGNNIQPPNNQNGNLNGQYSNQQPNYNNQPGYQQPNNGANYNRPAVSPNNQAGNLGTNNHELMNQPALSTDNPKKPNYEEKVKEDIAKILEKYPMNSDNTNQGVTQGDQRPSAVPSKEQDHGGSKPDPNNDAEYLPIDIRVGEDQEQ